MNQRSSPMWAISCYYNPQRYHSRYENYLAFRRNLQVPLITVELVYGQEAQLRVDRDAEILIQIPGRDVLWQKERLLNLALSAIPDECEFIACLDCNIVFDQTDWYQQSAELLRRHVLIQPFSETLTVFPQSLNRMEHTDPRFSVASLIQSGEAPEEVLFEFSHRCVTGLAWVGRREMVQQHGFYDGCIIGGGDRAIACAAWGETERYEASTLNRYQVRHYHKWANSFFNAVKGNIGCLDGSVSYVWHGHRQHRAYRQRYQVLDKYDFDPSRDIRIDKSGAWVWDSNKPGLHEEVADYFRSRREDDRPKGSFGSIPQTQQREVGGR